MNPEQMLNQCAEAIQGRDFNTSKQWVLCLVEGKILCIPAQACYDKTKMLICFSECDIQYGFNSQKWNYLKEAIKRQQLRET